MPASFARFLLGPFGQIILLRSRELVEAKMENAKQVYYKKLEQQRITINMGEEKPRPKKYQKKTSL